jgi:hypothetical protein
LEEQELDMAYFGANLLAAFRTRLTTLPPVLAAAFSTHVDMTKLATGSTASNAVVAFSEALERVLSGPHAADASVGVRATAAIGGSVVSDGP